MPVLHSTQAHELPSNNTLLCPKFGYFDLNVSKGKITFCSYLSETLAFETAHVIQNFMAWYKLNNIDDRADIDLMIESIKNKKTLYFVSESRKLCRDGKWRWFGMRGKVIELDSDSNPLRIVGTCVDVTKLKETGNQLEQARLLSFEIKQIKECQRDSFQLQDVCEEISKAFEKFTKHSEAQFIFSSHANPKIFYNVNGCDANILKLSAEETKFTEHIFYNKEHGFQNDGKIPLLGIYFNFPSNQNGILLCKRYEPFKESLLDFIVPLIETANNILSINIIKNDERKAHVPLASFVEHLPSPVAIFDNQMLHLYVNSVWKIIAKFKDERDFLGKSHYEVYLNQPASWKEYHQQALNGRIVKSPPENIQSWGDEDWHLAFTFPWYTPNGSIGGVIVYLPAVTEQMIKLNAAETQFDQMQLLSFEINHIKEYQKDSFLFYNTCEEILKSFEKFAKSSGLLLLSSFYSLYKHSNAELLLSHFDGRSLNDLELSKKKDEFIKILCKEKCSLVKNEEEISLLGIFFDFSANQFGIIIIERSTPFDDDLLNFLAPLIEVTNRILRIKADKKKSNEIDSILAFFVEQVPVSIAMFDTEMRHKFVSDSWKRDSGIGEAHEFIGKTYYEVYPKEPDIWRENHQKALKGEIITWPPTKYVDFFGKSSWSEGCISPWYAIDGSIAGLMMYSNNVTENIMAEKHLITLVDNLNSTNQAFECSNNSLKISNQALESFAHICSHDLKEPLRSISNFIHLLFVHNLDFFDKDSLIYTRHIFKGIDRMSALIQDILLYSKIAGRTEHNKILLDMDKIVCGIKEVFDYKLSEIGAQINIENLPSILGESTQINQLFVNLISNAIKFHSEKALVINIFAEDCGSFWEFHVCDNGIGIEQEYHESIFMMFKRLHTKNQYEGSGIGLATCHKIVNDHQGKIYVQSVPEGGSDFVCTFPKISK